MACDMMGPFCAGRRRALLKGYATSKREAREFLIGLVKHIAPGFVDEETRASLTTILIDRNHEFGTLLDLLVGDSFTWGTMRNGKYVEQRTQLVPLEGYAFISAETCKELRELAAVYRFEGFQGWRGVDWTPATSARNFEREITTLLAEETPSFKCDKFLKAYLKAIGDKVHDKKTKRTLTDVLDDADALRLCDVFRLLNGALVHDSYANHELNLDELCAVQTTAMSENLRLLFVKCGWANSTLDWSEF
jgi:hypothetical protein